jgi:DNA-binding response OmpR family regulator
MKNSQILVVEDSDRLRSFIVENLNRSGFETREAMGVETAIRELTKSSVELVLLDLHLGDGDGQNILKMIRSQNESLPVIIVSSLCDLNTKIDGFRLGCDDYVTKPFYIDELISRIRRILKRSTIEARIANPAVSATIASGPFELEKRRANRNPEKTVRSIAFFRPESGLDHLRGNAL